MDGHWGKFMWGLLFLAVTKVSDEINLKQEFIMAHGLRGYDPSWWENVLASVL